MKQTKRFGEAFGGVDQALPIMRQHQSMTSRSVQLNPSSHVVVPLSGPQ
jgi:hypothetical protein